MHTTYCHGTQTKTVCCCELRRRNPIHSGKAQKESVTVQHLLKPKVGGPQLTLQCLRDRLDGIFDITIAYPGARLSVWHLLAGHVPKAMIHVEQIELPKGLKKTKNLG